ncbi:EutP/PduV family microcompartment system protein [Aquibacillus rhizosphaerae]|uniref:EutP/PduV family microcompartment system protein n=1 Tax=Aquibacillus rhizosphaerae TaxID=3051431 RepID=A0ABT7L2Z3_9BACI|nr:EutP/PduV family microcompartment system protein [Aquibacillus sp. LR5S19]MDL4840236.1 EutP/PduV family microcompartment system protein [Aquibacillus sp. LR5S19]
MKTSPKKIHIIGSVGSGKTTLAKELSSKLDIPYYKLDNVVWIRNNSGDIRRTEHEYLNSILKSETWIIEGVHNEDWVSDCFNYADLIIFLDTNYSIRTYRIIIRFLKQQLRLEISNYKPTFKIFMKMFKWNRYFEEVGKVSFFNKYSKHNDKILVSNNTNSIKEYFN